MKNGFSSGRGFLRPFPQKSLLLAIRPPSRPTNRNASSLDSPLAYVQTKRPMRLRVAFTFSTRFFHPFSSSSRNAPATCKSFSSTIRISLSYLFISLIFIFNRHPRWSLLLLSIHLPRTDGVFLLSFHWWEEVSRDGREKILP